MAEEKEPLWFPGCPVYHRKCNGDWGPAFVALIKDLGRALGGGGRG